MKTNPQIKIRNLIFDIGDVLLDYRWRDMLIGHGMSPERAEYLGTHMFANPYWSIYDYGAEPEEVIVRGLQLIYPEYRDELAWFIENADQMPVERPAVCERIRELKEKGYRIYLLSNYPERLFKLHTKHSPFMQMIDGAVISYEVHMVKPERRIYQYLLDKYDLKAEECAFFEDRLPNVEAARRLGIDAHQVTSEAELLELLKSF